MPVTPTYPGVYIEEVSSGVHTISSVATSIAAFVGYTGRGLDNRATHIFSLEQPLTVVAVHVASTNTNAVVTMTNPKQPLQVFPRALAGAIDVDFSVPPANVSPQNFVVESQGLTAGGFARVPGSVTMMSRTRARFVPNQNLFAVGTYRVTLFGEGVNAISTNEGRILDGDPRQLPSGDGNDGGDFVFTMVVRDP